MSLTASEIEEVLAELTPLAGARVDAVRVHAERALTLELHGRGREALLLVSAEAEVTRLHVAAARPPQPATPYGWQALLRRELEGARLTSLSRGEGARPAHGDRDRVVALGFERAAGPVTLMAELTGRHGNLFLVDAAGLVRGMAARHLDGRRPLAVGRPYQPPEPRPEPEPGRERPAADRFPPVSGAEFPRSAAVEAHYAGVDAARALSEGRRRLREPLRGAVGRSRRALDKLAEEAARVPAAEGDRRLGDLLKASLHSVRRGAPSVTVTEWTEEGPREVEVALDPALGPRENMERYYRRFRRIVESAARVEARAAEVRVKLGALTALLAEVDAAPTEGLARLEREARRLAAGPRPAQPSRRRRDEPAPPYRAFRSLAGLPILVGRGAAENDELTRRVARGNDLWLHVRGQAGAHVVVKLGKAAPDQETLLDAAHLAAHFSDVRGEPQAEVDATRVKHVRKLKGSAPGAVTYSQEKVIQLRLEPARVARLLAEEEGAEG